MRYLFNKIPQNIIYIAFCLLFINCTYKTVETKDKTVQKFSNGKHITVEKINSEIATHGAFTKRYYGTRHRFEYNFKILQNNIEWNGGTAEPKNIVFCKDTTYIRYLKQKSTHTTVTDSIKNTTEKISHTKIQEFYEKHVDERYFFNLFGDDYWVQITEEQYTNIKNECTEYVIPNDNELSLTTAQ